MISTTISVTYEDVRVLLGLVAEIDDVGPDERHALKRLQTKFDTQTKRLRRVLEDLEADTQRPMRNVEARQVLWLLTGK